MTDSLGLPILPLKNTVLYPYVLMPVSIGRPASIASVEAALSSEDKMLAAFAQRDADVEQPGRDDLFGIGTRAVIKRMARGEEGIHLILQGIERVELLELEQTAPFLKGRLRNFPLPDGAEAEVEALQRELAGLAGRMQAIAEPAVPVDLNQLLAQVEEPMQFVFLVAAMAGLDSAKAQSLLESPSQIEAMRRLHTYLTHEVQVLEIQKQIATQAHTEIGKEQREYLLRQQLKAIQRELGERSPEESEVAELRRRFEELELPEEVRKEADRELSRLENIPAAAPDFQVTRTHLELILELPWTATTTDNLDLAHARTVLDEDHYGLKEIKERIIEHLAVLKLNPNAKAPILCFVGPPGVGKTSLGQSIARALGRRFERLSLGGLHDEAELRGHRRTYIGAMPGRIVQSIRRAEVKNPLLMLDEVDKLGRDFRGDPASALLEILDPAQNSTFRDNYLDLPFDLSKVFFITTANATDTIPRPLLDRMETLRLSGYSDEEKMQIALRYLLPRQRQEAGLTAERFQVPDETLSAVIHRYTREAGVRELERMLGRLARKAAVRFAEGDDRAVVIQPSDLAAMLGPERFFLESARRELPPGVATGLAWTESGGDVLYVEAIQLPEGERLTLTGQLGNVMKESARAAQSYVAAHCDRFGIEPPKGGLHVHVPAGAIPKDGPSAGVTIATAIASVWTGQAVRPDTAMTGEITLSGLVLPVGGIKEKVLAARRAGLKRVILPRENEKDLPELPEHVRQEMQFVLAERLEDVLRAAIPGLAERLE
ncbi:MAG TPA: endopeptidase La [Planctomycetaceae bacterium]|nr:endopeptidase La [Planctomycetaceae bacterium]